MKYLIKISFKHLFKLNNGDISKELYNSGAVVKFDKNRRHYELPRTTGEYFLLKYPAYLSEGDSI